MTRVDNDRKQKNVIATRNDIKIDEEEKREKHD